MPRYDVTVNVEVEAPSEGEAHTKLTNALSEAGAEEIMVTESLELDQEEDEPEEEEETT